MLLKLKQDYKEVAGNGKITTWPKKLFGVSLTARHDSFRETVTVESALVHIASKNEEKVFPLTTYTKAGEPGEATNAEDVAAHQQKEQEALTALQTLRESINEKETAKKKSSELNEDGSPNDEYASIMEELKKLNEMRRAVENEYREISGNPVRPLRETVNKYEDVIKYFDFDGDQITKAGKKWLRKFKPGGANIGAELDIKEEETPEVK